MKALSIRLISLIWESSCLYGSSSKKLRSCVRSSWYSTSLAEPAAILRNLASSRVALSSTTLGNVGWNGGGGSANLGREAETLLCGEVPSVPIDLQHACVGLLPDFEFSEISHEALLRCVTAGRRVSVRASTWDQGHEFVTCNSAKNKGSTNALFGDPLIGCRTENTTGLGRPHSRSYCHRRPSNGCLKVTLLTSYSMWCRNWTYRRSRGVFRQGTVGVLGRTILQ